MSLLEVRVPNIGGFKDVGVVEILVKAGDAVAADASLVTLESDKATMDVPAPLAGTVKEVKVKICLLYTSPSPRDRTRSRMPSSA